MLGRRMFASCVICAAMGLVADDASAQAPTGLRRTILSRHDGPTDGYETLEVLAEIDPNFVVDWHIHPGTEAGYALEGGGELRVKGEATQTTKPGSTWVIAPVTPHTLHNGGQTTKLALTYTVEKGKPLATPVPAPA
ncbi:MAG TPA: cupin domain-containing protein [Acetobacteraceae bacterium]|nr:cupin domain-containing protein [Acetobacteraceae bacterium]